MKRFLSFVIVFLLLVLAFLLFAFYRYNFYPTVIRSDFYLTNYRKLKRIWIKNTCWGKNKYYTTYGMFGNSVCATRFPDGGKSCDDGGQCLSGVCYMDSDLANMLIENEFGKEALMKGIKVSSMVIPPGSGVCKENDLPNCFSISGSVLLEERKLIDRVPYCD